MCWPRQGPVLIRSTFPTGDFQNWRVSLCTEAYAVDCLTQLLGTVGAPAAFGAHIHLVSRGDLK